MAWLPMVLKESAAAAVILFVVRPLAGLLGLWGTAMPAGERFAIGFSGIRGMGSIYYVAFALNAADFGVLLSILVHGTTVTPVMRRIDDRRRCAAGTHTVPDGKNARAA